MAHPCRLRKSTTSLRRAGPGADEVTANTNALVRAITSDDEQRAPMTTLRTDVIGIGNAIVDVIARTEDDFLVRHGMRKGTMALIDEARAGAIYDAMGGAVQISGGSAAPPMA